MINVFQPSLGREELEKIEEVFKTNWLGKGKRVEEFENKFAQYLGVGRKHIRSMNCCSEGLFSSMKILEIKDGDEVIIPTISFVGAANAICDNKSKLVFCDVNKNSLNVTARSIEEKITKRTKAVLLLHYGGVPCEMNEIMEMAQSYNINIIEDSACSVASRYKGKACGTLGDVGIWSFDAMKILVCGDGGALYVRDEEKANYAEKLMYFGLESKSGYSNNVDNKWWQFEISQFGHRSIMNDVTASMALVQLQKLEHFVQRRKEIHKFYTNELAEVGWIKTPDIIPDDVDSSYYFYHIQLKNNKRDELATFLRSKGVYTTFRYYPLHWVSLYGSKNEKYPNAEWAANNTLCIPLHQSLTDEEITYIVEQIKQFGKVNCL